MLQRKIQQGEGKESEEVAILDQELRNRLANRRYLSRELNERKDWVMWLFMVKRSRQNSKCKGPEAGEWGYLGTNRATSVPGTEMRPDK